MVDVVYRFGDDGAGNGSRPANSAEARLLLERGNDHFSRLFDPAADEAEPEVVSVAAGTMVPAPELGGVQQHEPFAAIIGCADARVPIELLFGRTINDLFVLRVAGNVLGTAVIGSLDYAIRNLPTVRSVVVLGHTSCGAVTAAAGAYMDPATYLSLSAEHQLRAIVDQLFPAVRLSHSAMLRVWGDEATELDGFVAGLVETAVAVNAAIMASSLRSELARYGSDEIAPTFGVYDLQSHQVGVPAADRHGRFRAGLFTPPHDAQGFRDLATAVAEGPAVEALLWGAEQRR
ncbi:MAG: carbonic anhydrase [Nitriliruptoraceae bacterium]